MANILFKIDAIKFGVFKLSSGKASPYYIDLRVIPSFPDAFHEICESYAQYITSQIGVKKLRPNRSHTLSRNSLCLPNRL